MGREKKTKPHNQNQAKDLESNVQTIRINEPDLSETWNLFFPWRGKRCRGKSTDKMHHRSSKGDPARQLWCLSVIRKQISLGEGKHSWSHPPKIQSSIWSGATGENTS